MPHFDIAGEALDPVDVGAVRVQRAHPVRVAASLAQPEHGDVGLEQRRGVDDDARRVVVQRLDVEGAQDRLEVRAPHGPRHRKGLVRHVRVSHDAKEDPLVVGPVLLPANDLRIRLLAAVAHSLGNRRQPAHEQDLASQNLLRNLEQPSVVHPVDVDHPRVRDRLLRDDFGIGLRPVVVIPAAAGAGFGLARSGRAGSRPGKGPDAAGDHDQERERKDEGERTCATHDLEHAVGFPVRRWCGRVAGPSTRAPNVSGRGRTGQPRRSIRRRAPLAGRIDGSALKRVAFYQLCLVSSMIPAVKARVRRARRFISEGGTRCASAPWLPLPSL